MADKKDTDNNNEFELFRAEMSDIKPHFHDGHIEIKAKPTAKKIKQLWVDNESRIEAFSDMFSAEIVDNEAFLEYKSQGIQHRVFSKMRTGKIHIEAELDLHGMTLAMAEPTLSEFIEHCQQQHIRYVRLIHGKGWSSKDNKPVLKSKLNQWLRSHYSVLAFCSATVEDGGTGALYVLLKMLSKD